MHIRKQAHWEQFLARYGYLIPTPLPVHLGEAIFVCFDPNWNPKLLELLPMSSLWRRLWHHSGFPRNC
jgi:hypothetical protein